MAASIPPLSRESSLCSMPIELRLEIFNYLLCANNIPLSYGYTGPRVFASENNDKIKPPRRPAHEHAMLFVSKELSAEYRQCYYERTTFFLLINAMNALKAVPALIQGDRNNRYLPFSNTIPDFWRAPGALLHNLRHCTIYIEIAEIARDDRSLHTWNTKKDAKLEKAWLDFPGGLRTYDSVFDSALVSSILKTLSHMHQLRSVQLVWDTNVSTAANSRVVGTNWNWKNADWNWETLGEPVLKHLIERDAMSGIMVKIGSKDGHTMWKGTREDREWKGDLEVCESYYRQRS